MVAPLAISITDLHVKFSVHAEAATTAVSLASRGFRSRTGLVVHALNGVSVQLRKGEALGLIGHNGAGKSTLLRALTGTVPPAQGRVRVSSQPQLLAGGSTATRGTLTGRQNIELGLLSRRLAPPEIRSLLPETVEFTGLGEFIDLPMNTYSSGMKARLRFAIATAVTPEILLLDEALAVGDRNFKDKSLERLNELVGGAGAVVLASHNMREIRTVCDRVLWLKDGKVKALGKPRDIIPLYKEDGQSNRDTMTRKQGPNRFQQKRANG